MYYRPKHNHHCTMKHHFLVGNPNKLQRSVLHDLLEDLDLLLHISHKSFGSTQLPSFFRICFSSSVYYLFAGHLSSHGVESSLEHIVGPACNPNVTIVPVD